MPGPHDNNNDGVYTPSEPASTNDTNLELGGTTPKSEWVNRYRKIVEYFEATENIESFESGGQYPDTSNPYVLHEQHDAPLKPGAEKEYTWTIILNPWPGRERTTWITDGEPLLPEETTHGAPDTENTVIATDRDLVEVHPYRAVVCVSLTKVAELHTRGQTWIHADDKIKHQFDSVLQAITNR